MTIYINIYVNISQKRKLTLRQFLYLVFVVSWSTKAMAAENIVQKAADSIACEETEPHNLV
jgi:hypothetical protein